MTDTATHLDRVLREAHEAACLTAVLPAPIKNAVIVDLAQRLGQRAHDSAIPGVTPRDADRIAAALKEIAALPDPVGLTVRESAPDGAPRIRCVRAARGLVALHLEGDPIAFVETFALALKAGNASIAAAVPALARTLGALVAVARESLEAADAPPQALAIAPASTRSALERFLARSACVDLFVISDDGPSLHALRPPRSAGAVCHVFVDALADGDRAVEVCMRAKAGVAGDCTADCILVHKDIADRFVPLIAARLADAAIELRGGPLVLALTPLARPAHVVDGPMPDGRHEQSDWGRDFTGPIIAMRIVPDLEEAVEHVNSFGSCRADSIVTNDKAAADRFIGSVRSSCVLVNEPTTLCESCDDGASPEAAPRAPSRGRSRLEDFTRERRVIMG